MPNKKQTKKPKKNSPSETIEKDQDELMSTLESIRGLLAQSEGKLNAARESISLANTQTQNSSASISSRDEEIVPILDNIVDTEASSNSLGSIPDLNHIFKTSHIESEIEVGDVTPFPIQNQTENQPVPDLATLTQKNLLIDALDNLQLDLEQSLRETLMKTMVTLEKDLKDRISKKIKEIKAEILK